MSATNPVFSILIAKGNQAILPKGNRPENLAVGQIGVFSTLTGLSIAADATKAEASEFYLGIGLDRDGDGATDDVQFSAGARIQNQDIVSYRAKCGVPEIQKVIEITNIVPQCDTDYTIKLEFSNTQMYQTGGYNPFVKSWGFRTSACDANDENVAGNNEVQRKLVSLINSDPDKLVKAELIVANSGNVTITGEPTSDGNITVTVRGVALTVSVLNADTAAQVATKIANAINSAGLATASAAAAVVTLTGASGTVAFSGGTTGTTATTVSIANTVVTDVVNYEANNPDGILQIRLTGIYKAPKTSTLAANLMYFDRRALNFSVSLPDGFDLAKIATTTQLQYSEGLGYDLQQLEYEASGWNGNPGPYHLSETMIGRAYQTFAVPGTFYSQFDIRYVNEHITGWNYTKSSDIRTTLAIPCSDDTTVSGIQTVLTAIIGTLGGHSVPTTITCDCP